MIPIVAAFALVIVAAFALVIEQGEPRKMWVGDFSSPAACHAYIDPIIKERILKGITVTEEGLPVIALECEAIGFRA